MWPVVRTYGFVSLGDGVWHPKFFVMYGKNFGSRAPYLSSKISFFFSSVTYFLNSFHQVPCVTWDRRDISSILEGPWCVTDELIEMVQYLQRGAKVEIPQHWEWYYSKNPDFSSPEYWLSQVHRMPWPNIQGTWHIQNITLTNLWCQIEYLPLQRLFGTRTSTVVTLPLNAKGAGP